MYIELLADTKDDIDHAKPMLVFFCVPHNTENVRANIRFLIGQLGKTRHYISPNPDAKFKYTAAAFDGIEVCFMCNELLERLVKSVEEIEYTNKAHLAQLRGDKAVKWFIDKPEQPTTEIPNPQITVASDSVFQVSSLLENSNITEIMSIAFLDDGTIGLPDLNPFNLESKLDDIRSDIKDTKEHFTGSFTSLMEWFASSFRGGLFSDINPFGKETIFERFSRTFNLIFPGGSITTSFYDLHHKAFMQSDTVAHDNSWFAKLGDISSISGWLLADDGRLKIFFENITQIRDYLDYHLGEVQYGIKHFFNVFATGTTDENLNFYQKIKRYWDKPNTEDELLVLQNSIFQNNPDSVGRGFTFYDFMTMWIKPHGENWQGNGYVNPSTNRAGHEPRTLEIGGLSALDTLIDRFSLAFLQTSNTTSILGKVRDILETGLLFSPSLGILTLINNSLQSIHGVLDVDLGWIARSTEEIAAKDCCSDNGSTTVTNPDGSQTTTPNEPTYPPLDPNEPISPTNPPTSPYKPPPPPQPSSDLDGMCGFIYYVGSQIGYYMGWVVEIASWIAPIFRAVGMVAARTTLRGAYDNILAPGGVSLKKMTDSDLGTFIRYLDNLDDALDFALEFDLWETFITDYACDITGNEPIGNPNWWAEKMILALSPLGLASVINDAIGYFVRLYITYGMYNPLGAVVNLADYAQYCPCPSQQGDWNGVWYTNQGSPQPWTLTQTGSSVTGHNANSSIVISGTASGLVLTGTYDGAGSADGTFEWTATASDYLSFTGNGLTSGGTPFGWSGGRNP